MARFFIHRPVFAWVLAIVTMLAGAWSITQLQISQYPNIAPTTIRINATYNGATAEAVQNSVTEVIEDNLTGLDGLLYTVATSSEGRSSISLTFDDSVKPIDALNEDQKLDLIALAWIGRGDFSLDEWAEARESAREVDQARVAGYLLGMPTVSDYLQDALSQLGYSLDDYLESGLRTPVAPEPGIATD